MHRSAIRLAVAGLAGAGLSGCLTTDVMAIKTKPSGAVIDVSGYGICESPCTIALEAPADATIAKAGYRSKRVRLSPTARSVTIDLELAAPTEGVEEDTLPEL